MQSVAAVLLYGPDAGLVSERAKTLVNKVAGAGDDPFGVVELTRRDLKDDPRRLADELAAIPLTGGRPVVRLRDVSDELVEIVADSLDVESDAGFLVVEAGELPPRSTLRKLFEGHESAAAIACYLDDENSLPGLIKSVLTEHGLSADQDAMAALIRSMGSDRMVSRQELEKLVLFKGDEAAAQGHDETSRRVTLDDVRASIGDSAEITLDDLAFAAGAGDRVALERAVERSTASGAQAVAMLRAVSRHFQRLHQVAAAIEAGESPDRALAALRPAVFWKVKSAFSGQVRAWGAGRLAAAIGELTECEVEAKSSGAPQALLVRRALLRLAANAPGSRR